MTLLVVDWCVRKSLSSQRLCQHHECKTKSEGGVRAVMLMFGVEALTSSG